MCSLRGRRLVRDSARDHVAVFTIRPRALPASAVRDRDITLASHRASRPRATTEFSPRALRRVDRGPTRDQPCSYRRVVSEQVRPAPFAIDEPVRAAVSHRDSPRRQRACPALVVLAHSHHEVATPDLILPSSKRAGVISTGVPSLPIPSHAHGTRLLTAKAQPRSSRATQSSKLPE